MNLFSSSIVGLHSTNQSKHPEKVIKLLKNVQKYEPQSEDEFYKIVESIYYISEEYTHNKRIQMWICHCISNLALNEAYAERIVNTGGWKLICTILNQFKNDATCSWKACSALWNLSRPESVHSNLNVNPLPTIFDLLELHIGNMQVIYTCFGALGNLVIAIPEYFF